MSAAPIARLLRAAAAPLPWSDASPGRQWALVLGGWSLVAAASFTRFTLGSEPAGLGALVRTAPIWVLCYGWWVAATPALAWLVWRYPLDRSAGGTGRGRPGASVLRCIPPYLLVGSAVTAACLLGSRWTNAAYSRWAGLAWRGRTGALDYFLEALLCAATLGALTAAARWHDARRQEQEVARLERVRLELENDLRDAQLQALRMKVNPHFLFNALQTVTALVRTDPRAAERTLARVGDVLRMALRLDLAAEITLEEELGVATAYLDLEMVRFRDRLQVAMDVEAGLAGALVPSLILQPLVENAIRHGVSRTRGTGELRVEARQAGGDLVLAVLDNGAGFEPDGTRLAGGIGLDLVRSRLEKSYPGTSAFTIGNRPEGGARVEMRFPLRRAESRSGHAA